VTAGLAMTLRLAARDLRGGLRGFYVFILCIALGVMAIAGVGSVAASLTDGIAREGRVILGGDLAFSLIPREASAAERGFLEAHGRLSVAANTSPAGAEFQQAVLAYAQRGPQAFQIVASGRFDPGWTRTGDLLSKIPMAGADVMLADAPWGSFLALHRTALKQGTCRAAVADGAASDDRGRWTLGSESGTSLLKAVWWNEKLAGNPESSAFVQAFRARYHHAPDWEQALAHEAARALFTAIEQAGTVEAEAVRAKLAALHMRSLVPGGEMSFPAASGQQAHYPFLLLQDMPDGAVTILFPAFAATAALEPGPAGRCRQLAAAR